jgi:hypothetical protein
VPSEPNWVQDAGGREAGRQRGRGRGGRARLLLEQDAAARRRGEGDVTPGGAKRRGLDVHRDVAENERLGCIECVGRDLEVLKRHIGVNDYAAGLGAGRSAVAGHQQYVRPLARVEVQCLLRRDVARHQLLLKNGRAGVQRVAQLWDRTTGGARLATEGKHGVAARSTRRGRRRGVARRCRH